MARKPSRRIWVALAVTLLVAITSAGLGGSQTRAQQPVAPLLMGMYGGYNDPQAMQQVRSVGATAMRIYVEWNLLQPYEYYNTSDLMEPTARATFERQLRNITDAGLTPIVLIGEAPAWASPRPRGPLLPDKLPSYVRFVELLVKTYSVAPYNVHYWELWPEPDAVDTISQAVLNRYGEDILKRRAWGNHGAAYAEMLKAVYPAIKRADPTAKVLNGAIAFDWFESSTADFNRGGIFNFRFLHDVIAAGGACCFDIVAFNSYAAFAPGWEEHEPSAARDIAAKTNYLRSELQRLGVNKPMMVMEVGFWSQGGAIPTRLSDGSIATLQPSPERHAAYLAKTYIRAASVGLQSVAWYTFRDQAYDSDKRGIVTEALAPKPAYFAYRQVADHLRDATYLGPLAVQRLDAGPGEIEGYQFLRRDGRRVAVLWLEGTLSGEATAQFTFPSSGLVVSFDQVGGLAPAPSVEGSVVTQHVGTTPVFVVDQQAIHRIILPVVAKAR
jgi:hypothetical protein